MREQLITEYHNLLAGDESLTGEFLAHLKELMRTRRLLYDGREIGVSLRPHLLTSAQYKRLVRSSEILAGALDKVAEAVLTEPLRMESIGLTERETRLALAESGYKLAAITTRLDAFIHGDEIKFVEYNAENPSSLTDQLGLNEILFEVAAMQGVAKRYQLEQFRPAENLLTALVDTFREWGGTGVPNVAVLDWDGLPTSEEFVLLRDFFDACGIATIICTPADLEYDNGRLHCGGFPIDLVYKRVIIHEFLASCDDSHPLIRAYLAGHVCLVNSFRCKLLHKKATFELLTDEVNNFWFTAAERQVIGQTVPWTRRLTERKTFIDGQQISLVDYVRKNRRRFVLKPNDDYGGHGISFGDCSTDAEWETKISAALASDYVVQQKIDLRTEMFPVFSEDGWTLQPMYVDTNPFLFRGRVHGALVRLSDSPVVNVTSGGGETGFFVVQDENESVFSELE